MPIAKRKLVVIEEGTLTSMALNQAYLDAFPFLSTISRLPPGRCGCARDNSRQEVFRKVRQAVAGLDSSKKQDLKNMLNAEQVRITFNNARGQPIQLTF